MHLIRHLILSQHPVESKGACSMEISGMKLLKGSIPLVVYNM